MEKRCIFCGKIAENKNKEHVIPQFLIKMTGDPKRNINLGFDILSEDPKLRSYSFDQFTFPACSECNSEDSKLEASVSIIIDKILNEKDLSEDDLNTLLDWFDKIRVGLWLGFMFLNKNRSSINPKYYINSRIKKSDRMLFVYKIKTIDNGINFLGSDTLGFDHNPTCFALRINNYIFLNISSLGLLFEKLGYFSIENFEVNKDGNALFFVKTGSNTITNEKILDNLPSGYCSFYQSIYTQFIKTSDNFINDDYIKNNSIDFKEGVGNIFLEDKNKISKMNTLFNLKNLNPIDNYIEFFIKILNWICDFQYFDYKRFLDSMSDENVKKIGQLGLDKISKYNEDYKKFIKLSINLSS